MAINKITMRVVADLQPGDTVWDASVKGFGVRRQRHASVYVFKYRYRGRQKFITIGRHGSPWTPDDARAAAKQYAGALASKERPRDPAAERDTTASQPTFAEFADQYLTRYASPRKKPRTVAEDRRNLQLHILPALGHLRLSEITRADVTEFHASQHARPINANRCLALISHIFTIAEKLDIRPVGTNPCRGVERYREKPRDRFLSGEEVARLGAALATASRGDTEMDERGLPHGERPARRAAEDWRAIACYRLLLFTGARLTEILSLRWNWIDWDRRYARLPDSKTGAKILTLTEPALVLLKAIQRKVQGEYPTSPFVLPGARPNTYFTGVQKPWQRIRALAGLQEIRIHDLRHAFASTAVSGGDSLYMVGMILGHRHSATTQRYAHLSRGPVHEVANRAAATIAAQLEASITSGPDARDRP